MYDYYKQVSRRRHQYGDCIASSFTNAASRDRSGMIPAYNAGVHPAKQGPGGETALPTSSRIGGSAGVSSVDTKGLTGGDAKNAQMAEERKKILPPLAMRGLQRGRHRTGSTDVLGGREGGGEGDEEDRLKRQEEDEKYHLVSGTIRL